MIEILKGRDWKKANNLIYQAQQDDCLSLANFPFDYRKIKKYCRELAKKEGYKILSYRSDKKLLGVVFLDSSDKNFPLIAGIFVQGKEYYESSLLALIAYLNDEKTPVNLCCQTKNVPLIEALNNLGEKAKVLSIKSEYVYYLSQTIQDQKDLSIMVLSEADITFRKKFLDLLPFDTYWTPKRLLASTDKRLILLALEGEDIIAIINATNDIYKTQEISNIFLLGDCINTLVIYQLLWKLFSYYQIGTKIVFNMYQNQDEKLKTIIERFGFNKDKETINYRIFI